MSSAIENANHYEVKTLLQMAFSRQPFGSTDAEAIMGEIIQGQLLPEQLGAFLGALATRLPEAAELTGFARALRRAMVTVPVSGPSLDTCGTGGDGGKTFNISTAVALLLAAQGIQVVKHGNRAVSSRSGSADVLEALGIPVQSSPEAVLASLGRHSVGFCFAPAFHPALKTVAPIRRNLGVRTVFNLLGPLCNPAQVSHQVLGVFAPELTEVMANALQALGVTEAMVVSAHDGLDELSLSGPTRIAHLKNGSVHSFDLHPEELGLETVPLSAVAGGDALENARLIEAIFQGQERGPARQIVLLNAAAALLVTGQVEDLREGLNLAAQNLDAGAAAETLRQLAEVPA